MFLIHENQNTYRSILLNHSLNRLHYIKYFHSPEKEWIIFLHGAGGSTATWKKQVDHFKNDFNLLLIDLRDHGKSKNIQPEIKDYSFPMVSDDLLKVMEDADVKTAHFITLSFGSILIQDFAMRHPNRIQKMVVVGGVFSGSPLIKGFVFTAKFLNLFLSYRQMYSLFSYILMPYRRNQKARKVYQKHATELTQKEYLKWVGLYNEFFNLLKTYHERTSSHKMLILMGGDDYIFLEGARKLAENQLNTELKILPRVGHIANIEAPKTVNSLALNFLLNQEEKQGTTRLSDTNLL